HERRAFAYVRVVCAEVVAGDNVQARSMVERALRALAAAALAEDEHQEAVEIFYARTCAGAARAYLKEAA
ncbi:MAG TPA: hypothetical protein VLC09_16075, partial [Polyangiaceae bacterium]|nr:hypothetical protein [Polyangiaceae bacterium]